MDDDELEFGAHKQRSARQGRRAAPSTPAADVDKEDELDAPSKPHVKGGAPPNRPNKAVSGWGEDAPKKTRSRQLGEGFQTEDERLQPRIPQRDSDDSDNDIPVIPELEELAEEDMSSRVAAAPTVTVNRVATYRELDNDLLRQSAFQVLDNDINLKLLTKNLSPIEDLIEEDRPWDWDQLFTEVSSELTADMEKDSDDDTDQADY